MLFDSSKRAFSSTRDGYLRIDVARFDEHRNQRRVPSDPVERLFDGANVFVARTRLNERENGRERIVGVMQKDILAREHRENILASLKRRGNAGRVDRAFQIGPL